MAIFNRQNAIVKQDTFVYAGAGVNYLTEYHLKTNDKVEILESNKDWDKIVQETSFLGYGYVPASFLEKIE